MLFRSLDDDANYSRVTESTISKHGLTKIAEVVYAPQRPITLNNKQWLWYEVEGIDHIEGIDLLIIDGPKGSNSPLARYPALPILFDRLNSGAVIILDDGAREDETEIVKKWSDKFEGLESEFIDTEKGTFIIRKS